MVVLGESQMGMPEGWHQQFLAKALRQDSEGTRRGMYDFCDHLPVAELLTAPAVVRVCTCGVIFCARWSLRTL
jgi:hypothetical protein